jgi:hypothetical protein
MVARRSIYGAVAGSMAMGGHPLPLVNEDFSTYADTAAMVAAWPSGGGANWSLSGGKALHAAGNSVALGRNLAFAAGTTYRVSYTVSGMTTGSVRATFVGGTTLNGANRLANGAYVELVQALAGNNSFRMTPATAFDGSVDDILVEAT